MTTISNGDRVEIVMDVVHVIICPYSQSQLLNVPNLYFNITNPTEMLLSRTSTLILYLFHPNSPACISIISFPELGEAFSCFVGSAEG